MNRRYQLPTTVGTPSIFLVGCEPAGLGDDEGHMGLSEVVSAAVEEAVHLIEKLVATNLREPAES